MPHEHSIYIYREREREIDIEREREREKGQRDIGKCERGACACEREGRTERRR